MGSYTTQPWMLQKRYRHLPDSSMALNSILGSTLSATASFPCLLRPPPPSFHSSLPKFYSKKLAATPMMIDFPHASGPVEDLMLDLVKSLETRFGSSLLPSSLHPDVEYFENPTGTAHGRLVIRSGVPSSPVDFTLGSWIHWKLPSGEAFNITSLSAFMKPSTDAPNFLVEVIQSSPTSLVVVVDLPPRKDLVLHPEYLKTFNEDTELDRHRRVLEKLHGVKPYIPSSLYIRASVSPSAVLVSIEEPEADETTTAEEIIQHPLRPAANGIMRVWLDLCVSAAREVGEAKTAYVAERDKVSRSKSLEIDLGANLPRIFGEETAGRLLRALEEVFNA